MFNKFKTKIKYDFYIFNPFYNFAIAFDYDKKVENKPRMVHIIQDDSLSIEDYLISNNIIHKRTYGLTSFKKTYKFNSYIDEKYHKNIANYYDEFNNTNELKNNEDETYDIKNKLLCFKTDNNDMKQYNSLFDFMTDENLCASQPNEEIKEIINKKCKYVLENYSYYNITVDSFLLHIIKDTDFVVEVIENYILYKVMKEHPNKFCHFILYAISKYEVDGLKKLLLCIKTSDDIDEFIDVLYEIQKLNKW